MNDSMTEATSGWSPMMLGGAALVGVVLLLLIIPTCRTSTTQTSSTDGGGGTVEDELTQNQCERTLLSALDGLQPHRLGLSSEARVMVDTLNNWRTQCAAGEPSFGSDADRELRERLLTSEGFERSNLERFQEQDAGHVRNSLLARSIVDRVVADARTDLDRAVELFYFVIRTVELVPDAEMAMQFSPYESLLFGAGTAADRTWVYSLLLRQLRLDAVMLQPRTGRDGTPYWIIGVIIPGEGVALFDPRLGLPIAVDQDSEAPLPRQPVMLAEARENDELLRRFDSADRAYPLTAEDLKTVDVFAIGTSSTWAPRMGLLQAGLPEPVELFDGLTSNELRETGLIDRLVTAGDGLWTAEQLRIWPYPESRWGTAKQGSEQQEQLLSERYRLLEAPFVLSITISANENGELLIDPAVENSQRSLRLARIAQLTGDFVTAQQTYLQTRLNRVDLTQVHAYLKDVYEALAEDSQNLQQTQQIMQELEPKVSQQVQQVLQGMPEVHINGFAADMANYWAAQCQYDRGDYQVAAESALGYLRRKEGRFLVPAVYLASISMAHEGQTAPAAQMLAQEPAELPQFAGDQQLVERWRRQSGEGATPDDRGGDPADAQQKETPDKDTDATAPPEKSPEAPAPGDADAPKAEDTENSVDQDPPPRDVPGDDPAPLEPEETAPSSSAEQPDTVETFGTSPKSRDPWRRAACLSPEVVSLVIFWQSPQPGRSWLRDTPHESFVAIGPLRPLHSGGKDSVTCSG